MSSVWQPAPALVLSLLLAVPLSCRLFAADLYVATNGRDDNAGTRDRPFASLARARDEIRQLKQAGPLKEPVTVHVRSGVYALPQTLKFEAQDGGSAAAPVVYRAYQNEKPVLVGGKTITGFVPYKGSILKTDVGAQGFQGVYFRQLIFDGQRQHLARYPNFTPQNPYGGGWAYADGKLAPMYADIPGEDKHSFTYKEADARTWARPEEVEVFVFARYNWWNNICRIKSVDRATRRVTLANDASYPIRPADRYYFQNALEELDAPGEWYLDKQTGTLYFWPPAPLEGKTVVAPTTRTILELGKGVAHLAIRGFILECAEGTAVTLRDTTNCLIAANTIRNVGDYNGSGVSVSGGFENGVVGNDIFEIGSHGVSLSGGDRKTLTSAENYADNNYIHHIGVFYKQGVGISLSGVGNRASHNLIHDGPRMGIMFSGNNLILEYNHIRHMNLETEDTGAVYTGGRDWISSRGSVIRYNFFHDMLGYGHDEKGRWFSPHFAWGVYLDDNTGGVDVIGNIVARCSRAGLHLHNGRDNHIENNILVENAQQQFESSGWTATSGMWKDHLPTMIKGYDMVAGEPAWKNMRNMGLHPTNAPLPDGKIMTGNEFVRNIVAWTNPKARYFRSYNVPFAHNLIDSNLVWHGGLPVLTGETRVGRNLSDNLLPHPGFEQGEVDKLPPGWWWQSRPGECKAVITTETAASGAKSLRIDGARVTDANGKGTLPSIGGARVPAKAGSYYRLTAKVKATKPGARLALAGQSHIPNVYYWAKDETLKLTTEWKEYEVTFKLPAPGESGWNARMTNVEVALHFREPDGAVFVDDLALRLAEGLDEWASWQALGLDVHSLVADPLFVDVAKDNYALRPNSPAFKLGFQPIPIEKIGPYRDKLRASWPIVEAEGAREKPLSP
jgi:parallel beta-helix repeat protein